VETQTDTQLMQRIQNGETEPLATLFERHHLAIFRYLFALTRNREAAEDLAQEVFFRVLKYAKSYKPEHSFRTWIFTMAHNASHDARHKTRNQTSDADLSQMPAAEPHPDAVLTRERQTQLLQQALDQLPPDKREVLVLSRYHELPYNDIASLLKVETGAVKVRAYRALKELRDVFFALQRGQTA
jgi:RNA polymerase sigma-70 factor (ECF subfamily)